MRKGIKFVVPNLSLENFTRRKVQVMLLFLASLIFNVFSLCLHFEAGDYGLPLAILDYALICWILSLIFFGIGVHLINSPKGKHQKLMSFAHWLKTPPRCPNPPTGGSDGEEITANFTSEESLRATIRGGYQESAKLMKLSRNEILAFTLIMILGAAFRIYGIKEKGLYPDELMWVRQGGEILSRHLRSPFWFIGDQPANFPSYLAAFFLRLTGDACLAARLPGVLLSLLYILCLFFFLKSAFNKKTAFIGAFLVSFSLWDIHNSTLGFSNINAVSFLITGSLLFLFRGLKRACLWDLYLAGIFLGMGINSLYIAALVTPVAFVFLFDFFLKAKRVFTKDFLASFLILFITVFFVISPTILKISIFPQTLYRHLDFFAKGQEHAQKEGSQPAYYFGEIKNITQEFGYNPKKILTLGLWGANLDPFTSFLFHLGLGFSFFNLSSPPLFLLVFLYLVMFIPVVVLYKYTSIWRLIGFSPLVYSFAAVSLSLIWGFLEQELPKRIGKKVVLCLFLLFLIFYLIHWGKTFLKYWQINSGQTAFSSYEFFEVAGQSIKTNQ